MKLLSPAITNPKTAKNEGRGYISALLHLAPGILSGVNVCPAASKGCLKACLNTAGRGAMKSVQTARIRKTHLFINERDLFLKYLQEDIDFLKRKAKKQGLKVAVRLNGTSDLNWMHGSIIKDNLDVQFYDYTKVLKRALLLKDYQAKGMFLNYDLTFSSSETNEAECLIALKHGINVAIVFRSFLPKVFWESNVISGENHDLRFLDPKGVRGLVIGLVAKGLAKKDQTGFVKESLQLVKIAV